MAVGCAADTQPPDDILGWLLLHASGFQVEDAKHNGVEERFPDSTYAYTQKKYP